METFGGSPVFFYVSDEIPDLKHSRESEFIYELECVNLNGQCSDKVNVVIE